MCKNICARKNNALSLLLVSVSFLLPLIFLLVLLFLSLSLLPPPVLRLFLLSSVNLLPFVPVGQFVRLIDAPSCS